MPETLDKQTTEQVQGVAQRAVAETLLPLIEPLHNLIINATQNDPSLRSQYESIQQRVFDNSATRTSRRN